MSPTPIPNREWTPVRGLTPLTEAEGRELAERFPINPHYVIAYGGLRWGVDRAFVAGSFHDPAAIIVQHRHSPGEPEFFGRDAEAAWRILSRIPGWFCVNGETDEMNRLAPLLTREIPHEPRWLGDLFYTLEGPPRPHSDPRVRLLGIEDIPLLQTKEPSPWAAGYRTYEELLTYGAVAAAIVDGKVVAEAVCTAANRRYADIGVHTVEPFRRRGFSSAAVYLVARELKARGLVPIWSTGSDNLASQRVAAKVGFQPLDRGEYVVFDGLKAAGGYRPA